MADPVYYYCPYTIATCNTTIVKIYDPALALDSILLQIDIHAGIYAYTSIFLADQMFSREQRLVFLDLWSKLI